MPLARRSPWSLRLIVPLALFVVPAWGCFLFRTPLTASQAAVLADKDDYDEGPERPMETENDPTFPGPTIPDDQAPVMTIKTLKLKSGHAPGSRRLMARIHSDRDYPPMGIHDGWNVVWRDTWDTTVVASATWTTTVTPETPGEPDHVLTRDSRTDRYPAVANHEPRVIKLKVHSVAFVACFEDPACNTGHCGLY